MKKYKKKYIVGELKLIPPNQVQHNKPVIGKPLGNDKLFIEKK